MGNTTLQSGALSRGFRLGKLGMSLTGSYLGYQALNVLLGQSEQRQRRFHKASSQRLRVELGSLKGAAMKLGQILSLQTMSLQEEALRELEALQMQAPGMHPTLARAQFKGALGKYPEEVFREFSEKPFVAASLGQVHLALTRNDQKVAVKIQYPAIRSAIESDLRLLRSAALPARMSGHLPRAVFDEVERGFLEETDYVEEGKNLEFFGPSLAPLKFVTIPQVNWELTTSCVLTMSFVEGVPLGRFLEQKPSSALRDLTGERLVELFYYQIRRLGRLHADHHPGNYLLNKNGRIGIVDFGCVKKINIDISELIRACVARSWRKGERHAREVLSIMFGTEVPYARARNMLSVLEVMAELLYPEDQHAKVDFGKGEVLKLLGDAMKKAIQDKAINPEFAFITRTELGLYSLLHQLRSKVDVRAIWKRVDV